MSTEDLNPRYITFDCYGTLINFEIDKVTKEVLGDRLPPDRRDEFLTDFSAIRVDEVLGPWKPYPNVIRDSLARAMARHGFAYKPSDADAVVDAIPTWGPHPEVPDALLTVSRKFPLVIMSNADPRQIVHNVEKLGAPFHRVLTSTDAHAYKPRHAAFEYMLNALECGPADVLHVSSSLRYDIRTAHELHIENKVYVNRGYSTEGGDVAGVASAPGPSWKYHEVPDLGGLPELLGL